MLRKSCDVRRSLKVMKFFPPRLRISFARSEHFIFQPIPSFPQQQAPFHNCLKSDINNLLLFLFYKKLTFPASFSLFSSFQCSWRLMFDINFCHWLDSNIGPLELEATTLPTEPQPLPTCLFFYIFRIFYKVNNSQQFPQKLLITWL